MKIALYARVSTDGQDPEVQLQALRAHATNRGWTIVEEFVDLTATRGRKSADQPWTA